jgi:glycosyltransferase involved in cell wall biosynthesis
MLQDSPDSHAAASPTVSVIIPVYNMADFIEAAITSVVEGYYDDLEVIVVNDGSTDETEQVVRQFLNPGSDRYDERVHYLSQPNQGKPAAVNRGMEAMSGTYLALLDADDKLPPDSLTRRVDALRENPSADMVIGGFEVVGGSSTGTLGKRSSPSFLDPKRLKHAFCLSYRTPFHFNACLLDCSLVERVGLFDSQLNRCQDIDYSIRCMEETCGVVRVDAPVYFYRKHRSSTWNRISIRLATARHRPYVVLKNFAPPRSYFYVVVTALLDTSKLLYELASNYTS